ncbi:NlpC/P60 family protein [Sinomonas sp. ASV486]|uniref:NlpC/P60 family protein n=1 Tax=Sinomonas puerhi TaxID=3238584 RepID=A0AB39L5W5_9MICC|nr:NlpC/P60 family protein [Sinomonas sp. ASV486]MDQ4490893.1 NlpC/P60 family protein [Sinomonas sp. ASV486]
MTTRAGIARHRADNTSSLAVIAKAVTDNAGGVGRQAAVIAAAGGLVLTGGMAANASTVSTQREASAPASLDVESAVQAPISAEATASVSFERPAVESVAAPVVEAPAPVAAPAAQTATTIVKAASTTPATTQVPASSSGMGAAIAAAAYAQLGVAQDCTMLVTNSLAAVGIHYHGWPAGYLSLGRTVSAAEAQPGDLAYYANGGMGMAHIAVYVGNGMAVHGGWNGGTTALFSVNVGSGPVFIRVGG